MTVGIEPAMVTSTRSWTCLPSRRKTCSIWLLSMPATRFSSVRARHAMRRRMAMAENAFTLLTLIAGPAVLTNACSVLALNTANRYGRAFDRVREVGRELAHAPPADPADRSRMRLL